MDQTTFGIVVGLLTLALVLYLAGRPRTPNPRTSARAARARVRARVQALAEDMVVENAARELRPAFGLEPAPAPSPALPPARQAWPPQLPIRTAVVPAPPAWPDLIAVPVGETELTDWTGQAVALASTEFRTVRLSPPDPDVDGMFRDGDAVVVALTDGTVHRVRYPEDV